MDSVQQYKDLLGASSAVSSAYTSLHESERAQLEKMRKMFDPKADIRKSFRGGSVGQHFVKDLIDETSIGSYVSALREQATAGGQVDNLLALHVEDSKTQTKKLLESLTVSSSIQSYLKEFEHTNKLWTVPNEVLDIVGSLKEIQEQLGLRKLVLPTLDWGSAAALVRALGPEGIQAQLSLLGIDPDGSMREFRDLPQRGILSRKQADVITLISFLLIFLIFFYQEHNNAQQQVRTDAFQTQTSASLQVQAQQIHHLTMLLEKALVQVAQHHEERFVVRDRVATIRSKPEHGSGEEGRLLPNEVVRAIDKQGKWVEVEYYHWLHETYRTGWVLKKYIERVPTSYSKPAN